MPDIVTMILPDGRETIPIVGTLVHDRDLGDIVRAGQEEYYLRPGYILRRRHVEIPADAPAPAEPAAPAAPAEPVETPWEIDPADPYAHLSPMTRRMLEERDRRAAEVDVPREPAPAPAAPPKRRRGRPRKIRDAG